MYDLIRRETVMALAKDIRVLGNGCDSRQKYIDPSDVKLLPALDAQIVKHARWLDGYTYQSCSLCAGKGRRSWRYCPHCGAKMDEVE